MNPKSSPQPSPASPVQGAPLRVAAAVVHRADRLLMTRRPAGGPRGRMWEFPGGKIEPGETPEEAVVRELREELDAVATVVDRAAVENHRYADGLRVEITFLTCTLASFRFRPGPEVDEIAWQRPADVDLSNVLAGDHAFLIRLGARPIGNR